MFMYSYHVLLLHHRQGKHVIKDYETLVISKARWNSFRLKHENRDYESKRYSHFVDECFCRFSTNNSQQTILTTSACISC
jgi:hypothetical protein